MKKYSDIEAADAKQINEIGAIILKQKNNWDRLFNDLNSIYNHIPNIDYSNNFEENGKYYHKFWDHEEFVSYCHYIKDTIENKEVVWLGNAYPKCCYFLSIICIERGDFKAAIEFLQKGLDLESDNPMLLSEMGLLLSEIGTNTGEKNFFNRAITYYDKSFNSRGFNTNSQKARALRGIGYVLIELKEYQKAKDIYESSLMWEESENAKSELKLIEQHLDDPEFNIFKGGTNFNEAEKIYSFNYFDEVLKKLSKQLQDKLPSKYTYIWSKASLLLSQGFPEYRKNDYFNYPLAEWNESELTVCINQIVHYLKGFDTCHYIETKNIENVKNLLLTFHFELTQIKQITNQKNEIIQEITFQHKVDNDKIKLFFKTNYSDKAKKKWWKLW